MNNITELVIGDPSGDGHDKTVNMFIKTNKTQKELKDIINDMSFDIDNICGEYEESTLSEEVVKDLISIGVKLSEETIKDTYIDHSIIFDIILQLFEIQDPTFKYEKIELGYIGFNAGYGLFE